jgi:hypothetical protein
MDVEEIIRNEAQNLFRAQIYHASRQADEIFYSIKQKLADFYPPENKAIFLDEIKRLINLQVEQHRKQNHEGRADPTCKFETLRETLMFYINQEIDTFPAIVHQKQILSGKIRTKVFVSYSHKDKEFLMDVQRHFKPFLKDINFWDDSKIIPGQKWKEEIRKAISETKIAILLVSTDFLGSDFISSDELPPLLRAADKDGAVILTVILKPCLFEGFPELNQYQAMNPPNKTVLSMSYEEREELWVNLVRQTKKILETQN